MTWAEFWAPNLIQWLVGGAITALVSTVVGLIARFLLKRWYERVGKPWLEEWVKSLLGPVHQAAEEAARAAKSTALELRETNGRTVTIPTRDDALDYLKDTNSRLVAQLVIQAAKHPEDFDSPDAPRPVIPTDGAYITGRHRLHPIGQDHA